MSNEHGPNNVYSLSEWQIKRIIDGAKIAGKKITLGYEESSTDALDSLVTVLADSTKVLLQHLEKADKQTAPVLLRLVRDRRRAIDTELRFLEMMAVDRLPPMLSSFGLLDLKSGNSQEEATLKQLLHLPEEGEAKLLPLIVEDLK